MRAYYLQPCPTLKSRSGIPSVSDMSRKKPCRETCPAKMAAATEDGTALAIRRHYLATLLNAKYWCFLIDLFLEELTSFCQDLLPSRRFHFHLSQSQQQALTVQLVCAQGQTYKMVDIWTFRISRTITHQTSSGQRKSLCRSSCGFLWTLLGKTLLPFWVLRPSVLMEAKCFFARTSLGSWGNLHV